MTKPETKGEACVRHGGKGGVHDPSCECCAAWTCAIYSSKKADAYEGVLRGIMNGVTAFEPKVLARMVLKEWQP